MNFEEPESGTETQIEQVEDSGFPAPVDRPLEDMNIGELREFASREGIDLGEAKRRGQIITAIRSAQGVQVGGFVGAKAFDLSSLYSHMPPEFIGSLAQELHLRGLIEPGDYFKPNAHALFRAAMLSVIKHDFLTAQGLAKKAWGKQVERKGAE